MKATRFDIDGPMLIECRKFEDTRGFFTERFRLDQWRELAPAHPGFVQDNYSWSGAGVLRGLHYQFQPAQGKLVTCLEGRILDVAVDIRPGSPTLGQHVKVELSAREPAWLWVPPGFAHGFAVTSPDGAGVLYKVDQPYNPNGEGAIRWNDPDLAIGWPLAAAVISPKDETAPSFKDYLASR